MEMKKYIFDVGESSNLNNLDPKIEKLKGEFQRIKIPACLFTDEKGFKVSKSEYAHGAFLEAKMKCFQKTLHYDKPILAIVTRNTAHQMSYLLAVNAFVKFGKKDTKTVINLDAHQDYISSAEKTEIIEFLNWGGFVVTNKFCEQLQANSSEYCIWGERGSKSKDFFQYYSLGNRKKPANYGLDDVPLEHRDIYLTIDLDVISNSYTKYGDGCFTKDTLVELLGELFKRIINKESNLVGIDITGLPITNKPEEFNQAYQQVNDIISEIDKLIAPLSNREDGD